MAQIVIRYVLYVVALLVVGPMVGSVVDMARASDGGQATAFLLASPVTMGLVALVAAALGGLAMGAVGAALVNLRTGMTCAGLVWAWAGWSAGRVDLAAQRLRGDDVVIAVGVETLLVAIVAGGLVFACERFARDRAADAKVEIDKKAGLTAMLAACAGGLAGAWVVSRSPAVGQALASGMAGGLVGGAVAYAVAPTAHRGFVVIGVCLAGVVGQVIAKVTGGAELAAMLARESVAWTWVTGWMWASGAMIATWPGAHMARDMTAPKQQKAAVAAG